MTNDTPPPAPLAPYPTAQVVTATTLAACAAVDAWATHAWFPAVVLTTAALIAPQTPDAARRAATVGFFRGWFVGRVDLVDTLTAETPETADWGRARLAADLAEPVNAPKLTADMTASIATARAAGPGIKAKIGVVGPDAGCRFAHPPVPRRQVAEARAADRWRRRRAA